MTGWEIFWLLVTAPLWAPFALMVLITILACIGFAIAVPVIMVMGMFYDR